MKSSITPRLLIVCGITTFCIVTSIVHAQNSQTAPASSLSGEVKDSTDRRTKRTYDIPRNAIFWELGGSGVLASINYERMITNSFGLRVGFGSAKGLLTALPMLANYYVGTRHRYEFGAGFVYLPSMSSDFLFGRNGTTLFTCTLGYKYQPLHTGVMARGSITPLWSLSNGVHGLWAGGSVGVAF